MDDNGLKLLISVYLRGNEEQTASKKGKLGHMFAENMTL